MPREIEATPPQETDEGLTSEAAALLQDDEGLMPEAAPPPQDHAYEQLRFEAAAPPQDDEGLMSEVAAILPPPLPPKNYVAGSLSVRK